MAKIAVISAILEDPKAAHRPFNDVISDYQKIVRGRMGIPFEDDQIAVISIVVAAELDEINSFTGKLGAIPNVLVKTAISKKEI